jgi:hypothetical protein
MQEAFTLYKLIILYALDKVRMPMTNAQICDLMLDKEYTTYFRVQEVLSEMGDAHLIHPEKIRNITQYTITPEGESTVDFFSHQISNEIRGEIDSYLKDHAIEMRNTISHPADYDRNPYQEYTVNCRMLEKGQEIFAVSFSVPTEEAAKRACENWETKHEEIYGDLLSKLL